MPFGPSMPGSKELQFFAANSPDGWCSNTQQAKVADGQCRSVGLQRMWVVSLLAAHEHEIITERNGDDECAQAFEALYPGQKDGVNFDHVFRTPPATIVWVCEKALGDGKTGSCKYETTGKDTCRHQLPGVDCEALFDADWALQDLRPIQDAVPVGFTPEFIADIASRPTMKPILELLPGDDAAAKLSRMPSVFEAVMSVSADAEKNSKMFQNLCASKAAMLNMAPSALSGQASSMCAHWILLDSCQDDKYVVWSNGHRIDVAKAVLESSTCGGVVWG
mmetsp:Transcript_30432/g.55176  ORF Transcript_30432/g.55176 Transcript_30432/m.55176 type:complete len:278 (+) Transcript_30432:822-1655(+)